MNLGTKYKIESDTMNVTVSQKQTKKKDKSEYWRAIGYFANIHNALKFIADLEVSETGMGDFKAVIKKQEEIYKLIDSLKKEKR